MISRIFLFHKPWSLSDFTPFSQQANDVLNLIKEVYKSLCKDSEFEMKVFLFPNIRCFQALYNILTINILQNYRQIMKQNHAEKPCNLHWITPQLASDDHAFWLKQPCNLRQITPLHKWNCIRKTLKLKNNVRFLAFLFLFGDAPKC